VHRSLNIAAAVLAAALAAAPGAALAHGGGGNGGGNGTPSPPPSQPPCDADGHNGSPPPYGGSGQGSHSVGQCSSSSSSTTESSSSSSTSTESSSSSTTESSTSSTTESSSSSTSSSSSSTGSTGGAEGVCDSGGALPIPSETGGNETIGDAVADGIMGSPAGDLGGLIQDPGERGWGPVSSPLSGLPAPLGNEAGCLVNVIYLQGGGGSLPNGL